MFLENNVFFLINLTVLTQAINRLNVKLLLREKKNKSKNPPPPPRKKKMKKKKESYHRYNSEAESQAHSPGDMLQS